MEVDFIIGDAQIAIEVKLSQQVHKQDLNGLMAFQQEHPSAQCLVVSQDLRPRKLDHDHGSLMIWLWSVFLQKLWNGEVF